MLGAASACRVPRFVFLSSASAIHGDDMPRVPWSEDDVPAGLRRLPTPYGESKLKAEHAVLHANGVAMRTVVLRPQTVFGPGDTLVTPNFVDSS